MSHVTNRTACRALSALLLMTLCAAAPAKTIYVDDDATGANDGSSWENAFVHLQDGLGAALLSSIIPIEIRVAQGTYKPDQGIAVTPTDREATFQLINGVTLKGGYAGVGGVNPNTRDIELYQTILSGDLNGDDVEVADPYDLPDEPTRADNSCHVVTASDTYETAVLDGFTITAGNANDEPHNYGGGMYVRSGSPTVMSCTFVNNSAGGEHVPGGSGLGGAVYNQAASTSFVDCTFCRNSAWAGPGGAICNNQHSSIELANCILVGNWAAEGAGMYNTNSSPILTNCTFSGNRADHNSGGMINDYDSHPVLTNCVFWADACVLWPDEPPEICNSGGASATVNYCNVQGGFAGEGNIDADPLFADPGYWDPNGTADDSLDDFWVDGDYHLKSQAGRWDPNPPAADWVIDDVISPCIDAGDPNSDWSAELWPHGGRINMGAYGGTTQASMSLSADGDPADCDNDYRVDGRDLLMLCEDWLTEGVPTAADMNRDGVVDFSDYSLLAAKWLQAIPKPALVAHWKLDETDGEVAYDSAGANHATVHNGQWSEGKIDGALALNGLTTYLDCGDSEVLGPEKMTLAMWLWPEHMGGMRYVLASANEDTDVMDYMLMRQYEGELEFAVGQLDSDPASVMTTAQTPLVEWSHVAICLDGSAATIYVNGQPDATVDYSQRVASEGLRLVISSYQASTRFFNGKIDDVRIYNFALSQQEIAALREEALE